MKLKSIFLSLTISILFCSCSSKISKKTLKNNSEFRIVGYLASHNFSQLNKIQYKKLTHLNVSFANPDIEGNLSINGDIDAVIKKAKEINPNIIISISLAGGGVIAKQCAKNWSNLIDNPLNRPNFIKKIIAFVKKHNLDGIDVDLELEHITKGYSDFVTELSLATAQKKILLTAALPNSSKFINISDAALHVFDFINIMSYSERGPWAPNDVGQHSSLQFAQQGLAFWKKQGVTKEKLTLGVPFYGFDYSTSIVKSKTYKEVISDKGVAFADKDIAGKIFYNGRATIKEKTKLALQKAGGIMIWELSQDSFDAYSLLDVIYKEIKK
ncbi:MAG: glycosyl hydrolase family 18 protein [Polaribacter sp.]